MTDTTLLGTASLEHDTSMVSQIFNALRQLATQGIISTSLLETSSAADPIIKKVTGKRFYDYLEEKCFNKHGNERLARLVRIHAARLRESMPQQSVKFFTSLARKIANFVEKTPILKQVFDSVKSFAANRNASAAQGTTIPVVTVDLSKKRRR
jgi:hypothetical protein